MRIVVCADARFVRAMATKAASVILIVFNVLNELGLTRQATHPKNPSVLLNAYV